VALVEAIEQAAAGELDGLVVSMPPQHGKSELCSKYLPAWYLGTFPDRRVILVGYEADFAASWGRKARDVLERYGRYFGVKVSPRSSAASRWDLLGKDGGMVTAGVGGPITGKGAHLLIVDDPIKNDEEARSPIQRQKQWEWWQSVATTRLRPEGLIVVIQTRWHRDDLTGRILEQAKQSGSRWGHLKLSALAEPNDPLGRAPGEALWPQMYSAERLEQLKAARTPYYWQALYQQNPIAEGSSEWPETYFGPEIWCDEWPQNWLIQVWALDPSKGTDAKFGDYAAFVRVMITADGTYYVASHLGRHDTAELVDLAVDFQQRSQTEAFGIEVNQFQYLLQTEIERRGRELGVMMPMFSITNQVNKLVRIRRLTPYLSQRRFRFLANVPGNELLVEQLKQFPHGEHDDGPDALEMAVRLAEQLLNQPAEPEEPFTVSTIELDEGPWSWR
jgi:predicted phage terminase large subunit-like protein